MKKSFILSVLFAFAMSFGVLTAFPAHASTDTTDTTSKSSKSSKHHHKSKHSKSKHKDTDARTGTSTNQG
jgi:ABC-type transporter MlaC component